MNKPCMRTELDCGVCGALATEECPYDSLTEGLQQAQPATVIGGDCSGEDGVCQTCQ